MAGQVDNNVAVQKYMQLHNVDEATAKKAVEQMSAAQKEELTNGLSGNGEGMLNGDAAPSAEVKPPRVKVGGKFYAAFQENGKWYYNREGAKIRVYTEQEKQDQAKANVAIGASLAGAVGMFALGSKIGAAIGTAAGPFGTLLGYAAGGVIGAAVGAIAGSLTSCNDGTDVDVIDLSPETIFVNVTVKNDSDALVAAMKEGNAAILAALNTINQNIQAGNYTLKDILQELQGQTKALNAIITNQIDNGVKLDDLKTMLGNNTALLQQLVDAMAENNQLVKELKDQMGNDTDRILAAIFDLRQSVNGLAIVVGKLGDEVKADIDKLIDTVQTADKNNQKGFASLNNTVNNLSSTITAKLNELIAQGKINLAQNNAILAKLNLIKGHMDKGFDVNYAVLSEMLEILNEINGTTKSIDEKMGDITTQLGISNQQLDAIRQNGEYGNLLLNEIYKMLGGLAKDMPQIKQYLINLLHGQAQNGATLEDIAKILCSINFNVMQGNALVNQFAQDVLAQLNYMEANDRADTLAILEAMSKLKGGNIDLSEITQLLKDLKALGKENNSILKNMSKQNDIVIGLLTSFKTETGDRLNGLDEWLQKIYEKIPAGGSNNIVIDFGPLINKLDEILVAIKNIPTTDKITVDITGKVTCECNCGNNHEGIIGNLGEILA